MGIGLTDEVEPLGTFAIAEDTNIKGGYHTVVDLVARDAVPTERRKAGMLVWVESEGVAYRLGSGLTNGDWEDLDLSTGGWIRITDIQLQGAGTVTSKVYADTGNTVIQSATVSDDAARLEVECSFPNILVNGVPSELPRVGDIYFGTVDLTVGSGTTEVRCHAVNGESVTSTVDTVSILLDQPPAILTLLFVDQGGGVGGPGTYPGLQTELKAGDTIRVQGTTDKFADAIQCDDFGACTSQVVPFGSSMFFSVFVTIADRGTTLQSLAGRMSARDSVSGAYGPTRDTDELGGTTDGVDLVQLNNLYPTVNGLTGSSAVTGHAFSITYPGIQTALKGAESADVVNTASNFDSILYSNPVSEVSVPATGTFANPKTVSRIGGTYNIVTDNFQIAATRAANDATKVVSGVVVIADTDPVISVSTPFTRLRSGGNNGTTVQDYTISISSSQELLSAPSLDPEAGGSKGAFQGGGFTGGPSTWTRTFRVSELVPDTKGTFTWANLSTTNRAGKPVTVITGGTTYTLGGFVARTLTYGAFASTTVLGTEVVDFGKLTAGTFTATSNAALKQSIGTSPVVTDGYTIDAVGVNPTSVIWLDTPAVNSNSSGTAAITDLEETV